MVNIVIHIENKWFFFYSSFSVNLKIYTLHCDPAEEKNIFFFSLKSMFSWLFFSPPFWGEKPLCTLLFHILHLLFSPSLFFWMNGRRGVGTPEHTGTMMNTGKGADVQREPRNKYTLHHPSHAYSKTRNYTHAHTHFPHRHPLTVLKQKDKKKKLNLSPNNDIKNKTMWTFTIIISARGQEEAGAAVIL